MLSPNGYQLLEAISENIELVPENIQETNTVRLPGMPARETEIYPLLKILEAKDRY